MSIFSRIKQWINRVVRGTEPSDRTGLKCSICGTPVPDAEEQCPLCGSSDLVSERDPRSSSTQSLSQDQARQHTEPSSDASVAQLQQVRTEQILANHPDAWTEIPGGYEVSVANETTVVDSKQEAARLLKERK